MAVIGAIRLLLPVQPSWLLVENIKRIQRKQDGSVIVDLTCKGCSCGWGTALLWLPCSCSDAELSPSDWGGPSMISSLLWKKTGSAAVGTLRCDEAQADE